MCFQVHRTVILESNAGNKTTPHDEIIVWQTVRPYSNEKMLEYQQTWPSEGKPLYLFLYAFKAAAILLEIVEGFLHQAVQIHLVAELQLRVSLQQNGHHHQQLLTQWRRDRAVRNSKHINGNRVD